MTGERREPVEAQTADGLLRCTFGEDGKPVFALDGRLIPQPHAWEVVMLEWKRARAALEPVMGAFSPPDAEAIARLAARGDSIGPAHRKIEDLTRRTMDYPARRTLTQILAGVWEDGEQWGRTNA